MKFPVYNFRPSNCDALHLDLWQNGNNILRDGGSYCYSDINAFQYYAGNQSHNTVQFNAHNQSILVLVNYYNSQNKKDTPQSGICIRK